MGHRGRGGLHINRRIKPLPGEFRLETQKCPLHRARDHGCQRSNVGPGLGQPLKGPHQPPLRAPNCSLARGLHHDLSPPQPYSADWQGVCGCLKIAPYTGGGRSEGGRCRSRARDGTGSSQSSPEVRTPSAPPLCREQSPRDERGAWGRAPPYTATNDLAVPLTSQGPISHLVCKMGAYGRGGALSHSAGSPSGWG